MLSSPAALANPLGQSVHSPALTYWLAVQIAAAAPSAARRVQSAIRTNRGVARTIFPLLYGRLTAARKGKRGRSVCSCAQGSGGKPRGCGLICGRETRRLVSVTLFLTNNYRRRLFVLRTPAVQRDGLNIALSVHVVVVRTCTPPLNKEAPASRLLKTR